MNLKRQNCLRPGVCDKFLEVMDDFKVYVFHQPPVVSVDQACMNYHARKMYTLSNLPVHSKVQADLGNKNTTFSRLKDGHSQHS